MSNIKTTLFSILRRERSVGTCFPITMRIALATFFFCVVSVQAQKTCPVGPDVLVQYKVSYANLSKCGFQEFTNATPPRIHIYHHQIFTSAYDAECNLEGHSGTNSYIIHNCTDGFTVAYETLTAGDTFDNYYYYESITNKEWILGWDCNYSQTMGGTSQLDTENEDNRTHGGLAAMMSLTIVETTDMGFRT